MAQNEDAEDDVYASMICDDGSWQVRSTGGDKHSRAVDTFNPVRVCKSVGRCANFDRHM
jgi:hypothetical protein